MSKSSPAESENWQRKWNAMGMKFGLWFEPEMVSADSDLYREHPGLVHPY